MADVDPRLEGKARTLNEELLRGTIRHGVNLDRLKNSLVQDTIVFLNDQVFPDIVARIQTRLERLTAGGGVWTTQRYADLLALIAKLTAEGIGETHVRLEAQLDQLAAQEATWQKKQVDDGLGVDIGFDLPSPEILKQIVRDQPFAGMVTKDWFDKLDTNTADRLVQQVNIGLAQGETVDLMVQRIRGTRENAYADGVLETTRHEAEAIVRTAATHVTARAREATYVENSDVIAGVQWSATLDDVTCPVCGKLDGQVFPVGEGPRPPAHWNCRCDPTPALKSWQELGIDLKEAPPGTRASVNGEVPDALSYEDWLKGEDVQTQENALGVTRAKLFREGDLTLAQFSNDRGQTITLDELARTEGVEVPDQYRKAMGGGQKISAAPRQFDTRAEDMSKADRKAELKRLEARMDEMLNGEDLSLLEKRQEMADLMARQDEMKTGKSIPMGDRFIVQPKGTQPRQQPDPVAVQPEPVDAPSRKTTAKKKSSGETKAKDIQSTIEKQLKENEPKTKKLREPMDAYSAWWDKHGEAAIDSPEGSALRKTADALLAKSQAAARELAAMDDALKQQVHDLLRVANPTEIEAFSVGPIAAKAKAKSREAAAFLSSITSRSAHGPMQIRVVVEPRIRAFAQGSEVHLAPSDLTRIYAHEMGHLMESQYGPLASDESRAILSKTKAFLQKRADASGHKLVSLKELTQMKFDADEMAWRDEFIDAYMGKSYDDATEILSMGVEWLYDSPVALMRKDPEYFRFIVDLLRGNL